MADRLYLCDGTRYRLRMMDASEVIGLWKRDGHFEVHRGAARRVRMLEHIAAVRPLSVRARVEPWYPLDLCYDSRHAPKPDETWRHPYRRAA